MGFLQQSAVFEEAIKSEASNTQQNNSEKSNSVGLLKRIIRMNEKNRLDFFDYVNKYNLSQCAVLRLNNGVFQISSCYGFDSSSILKSISTVDFWDGLAPKKDTPQLFSKKDNSIQPLYQFFSEKLIETIDSIILYRSQDDVILFCSSSSIEELLKNEDFFTQFCILEKYDFDFAFSDQAVYEDDSKSNEKNEDLYIINLFESIQDFIQAQTISDNQKLHFGQVIFYNIFYTLKKGFPHNVFEEADYTIYLYNKEAIPEKLLTNHLKCTLVDILGESSSKISITFESSKNKKKVKQADN